MRQTASQPNASGGRLTRSGDGFGSWPYMPPEQWRSAHTAGPASDIYALGILAYEALTGRLPFEGECSQDFYVQHLNRQLPPLGDDFPPELDRVLRCATSKDATERHGSALEVAAQLRAVLRAQPREQLRLLAQVWADRARPRALLLKSKDLLRLPASNIGELERAFVAKSVQQLGLRARLRGALGVGITALIVAAVWYRGEINTELAEQRTHEAQRVAEVTTTQSELEQGRAALLHNEPEALDHLAQAYRRAPSPSTAFMLARAAEPRLAELARFPSSFGRMWSAVFSPSGDRIVTTDDRNAQVWDAKTYQRLFVLPHGTEVYQALYSTDGDRIITAAGDGAVRIWAAADGALIRTLRPEKPPSKPLRYFRAVASHDDRLVAAIDTFGGVAHVWSIASGAVLAELHAEDRGSPSLSFSADSHWLAMAGGGDAQVFDTRTWQSIIKLSKLHIRRVLFGPTGSSFVTGSSTGEVTLWSSPSGARVQNLRVFGDAIDSLAISPDGQFVAAASRDGNEQVWRADSGTLQSQMNPRRSRLMDLEFDPSSHLLLAAGVDGALVVADVAEGVQVATLEGPQNLVWSAHFDRTAQRIIGASWDGTARFWDATPPYRRWSTPPTSAACGIVTGAEPDRRFVAVGCRDQPTRVWDTARDQLVAELPGLSRVEGDFVSAFPAVSIDGKRAAIVRGNAVEIYELAGKRLLRTIAHGAPVNTVAFAGTGHDVVSGAIDGSLIVAREDGALITLPVARGGIDAAAFLADGRIVAADAKRRLRVFSVGGAALADIELPGRVMSLRSEGGHLVTIPIYTGNAASPVLVDLDHHRVIGALVGHVGQVFSARWIADHRVLTAGADGTARIWDGVTGQLRQTFRGGPRHLADAILTPDGLLIAGGGDGALRFWDAASGRQLWRFQAHTSQIIGIHLEGTDIVTRGFNGELARWHVPDPRQAIGACSVHDWCATVLQ